MAVTAGNRNFASRLYGGRRLMCKFYTRKWVVELYNLLFSATSVKNTVLRCVSPFAAFSRIVRDPSVACCPACHCPYVALAHLFTAKLFATVCWPFVVAIGAKTTRFRAVSPGRVIRCVNGNPVSSKYEHKQTWPTLYINALAPCLINSCRPSG